MCRKGEFRVGVIGLDHGHIFGMCNGIIEAGAELAGVYDPDPAKVANFQKTFPDARAVASEAAILEDPSVHLIASAAVPSDRCGLGLRAMDHGKDYFTDKPPFTTLDQIASDRRRIAETNRKYAVYYSEQLHVEAAVFTETLIADGAIGDRMEFPQSRRRLGQGIQPGDGGFCSMPSCLTGNRFPEWSWSGMLSKPSMPPICRPNRAGG